MHGNDVDAPQADGVFGPEIILNTLSGHCCLRFRDGRIVGDTPEQPLTNAFLVWVGWPVIVISDGVHAEDLLVVAKRLREMVRGAPSLPVVATMGRLNGVAGTRAISDGPESRSRRDLARAQAYVEVQCAWAEDTLSIEMDGEMFEFDVTFQQLSSGTCK